VSREPRDAPQFYLTSPAPCPYLPGREERKVFTHLVGKRATALNDTLTQSGFRRSQTIAYRPACEDCRACVSVRVKVDDFQPSRNMRRILDVNADLIGHATQPEPSSEQYSLFRAYLDTAAAEQVAGNERTSKSELAGMKHAVDSSGRVLRDNVWGPQDEDATRRDFTVNAMYYDPQTQVVVDFHGGLDDARKKLLRMIGDPATRYREDPVRIIRAVRFAAKLNPLGFKLEPKTAAPLKACLALLADVPQSRLFDEMLKLLQTGHSLATIAQLKTLGLEKGIYPLLDLVVERAEDAFVRAALQDTDRRVGESKPVAPSFLLAAVLWSDVREGWARRQAKRMAPFPALQEAIDVVFDARIGDVSGRGKLGTDMREIWMMQPRFDRRVGSAPFSLVEQPRFRAGFDFMRLRADVGEVDEVLADWWQEFSLASDAEREDLLAQVRESSQRGPRRVRAARPAAEAGDDREPDRDGRGEGGDVDEAGEPQDRGEGAEGGDAPARKRRRRRRKPGGGSGSAGGAAPAGGEG
jgi:poly(A) polymerase